MSLDIAECPPWGEKSPTVESHCLHQRNDALRSLREEFEEMNRLMPK